MRFRVIGDWHNARVTAACLAHLGHGVGYPSLGKTLEVNEPGLDEMIAAEVAAGRLKESLAAPPHFTWIAIDTPVDDAGTPQADAVMQAAKDNAGHPYIISSQVPIGTCRRIQEMTDLSVYCIPENMQLGNGIAGFLQQDRLVVGADVLPTRLDNLLSQWSCPVILCSLETAEMIKHATNAFFATSISFANELEELGRPYGVDSAKVTEALRADNRIGSKARLRAGDGYSMSTLGRDMSVLSSLPGARLMRAVQEVNARPRSRAMATWTKERA